MTLALFYTLITRPAPPAQPSRDLSPAFTVTFSAAFLREPSLATGCGLVAIVTGSIRPAHADRRRAALFRQG